MAEEPVQGLPPSLVISFLDDRRSVKLTGDIAWTGDQGIGVRFDSLADPLLNL